MKKRSFHIAALSLLALAAFAQGASAQAFPNKALKEV